MLSIGDSRIVQEDGKKDNVDYVVKKLCQHIRSNLTSDEWCKFEEQKTDRGRIELFVQNEEIQSCVKKYLGLHPTNKDKAKALILKSLGTRAFGAGDDEKALSLYTQSLVWMPHDGTKGSRRLSFSVHFKSDDKPSFILIHNRKAILYLSIYTYNAATQD